MEAEEWRRTYRALEALGFVKESLKELFECMSGKESRCAISAAIIYLRTQASSGSATSRSSKRAMDQG
jgi:hypothetical protein